MNPDQYSFLFVRHHDLIQTYGIQLINAAVELSFIHFINFKHNKDYVT